MIAVPRDRLAPAVAVLLASSIPTTLAAQSSGESLHPEQAVARAYAPILWPAVDERILPSLPYALAFDGVDNPSVCPDTSVKDLQDPCEVRFGFGTDVIQLIRAYDRLATKPRPRVLYAGPRPFQDDSLDVLEYWFYFFYDQGPFSHVHDSEHAFVFLDVLPDAPAGRDHPLQRYDTTLDAVTGTSRAVRVIAAGAHDDSTANNVLAATRGFHRDRVVPTELPSHVPILIERGKHASAPDVNLDGRFDPGMDANVFLGSVWGSRDSFSAGLGESGLPPFDSWQSFPRQLEKLMLQDDYFDPGSDAVRATYAGYDKALRAADPGLSFSLFPLEDLEELSRLLGAAGLDDAARKRSVEGFLTTHKECFWGDAAPESVEISREAFDVMRHEWAAWAKSSHSPMRHPDHVAPEKIFKLHLYPRLAVGASLSADVGQKGVRTLSVELADIPWKRCKWEVLSALVCPDRLFTNSRLELRIGTERDWALQYYSMTWKAGRGNRAGPYLGLQFRKEQIKSGAWLEANRKEDFDRIVAETGVDETFLRSRPAVPTRWILGIRAGLTMGHSWRTCVPGGCRFEAHVGAVIEPQQKKIPSDLDLRMGAKANVRIQTGVSLIWNTPVWRPKPWRF